MKPIRTEVALHTPWIEVLAKTYKEGEAPYYALKLPDYTSIVALTPEGRVVIVRQFRPAVDHHTLELPSGLVDPGETPVEAARRELLGSMEPDTGRLGNRIWACVAHGVQRVEGAVPEEGMEVLTWSTEELVKATMDGRFDHALHVAIVCLALLKGHLAR
jgi:ADP-ribose pyrophosphatase